MRIIIGRLACEPGGFRILGEDGEDITRHFCVTGLRLSADLEPGVPTQVTMTCLADVDIEAAKEHCVCNIVESEQTRGSDWP